MTLQIKSMAKAFCLAVIFSTSAAVAQDEVLLTVTTADNTVIKKYDIVALKALGEQTIETTTIWTDGTQKFTGVSLLALFNDIGVSEGDVKALAINDYSTIIPVADAIKRGPIVAYSANGQPMSVRDKGPLWIIYPYDSNIDYQTETIYSRSIWQLDRLVVDK